MKKNLFYLFVLLSINVFPQTTDWVKSFGGTASDKGISIGTDSLGFIYISGYYNNEATFGSITLSNSNISGNNKENFIAKLDSNGNVLWAIPGGNQSFSCCDDRALGMHVTPGGDVFITGTYWGSYKLGVDGAPGTITATGGNNHDTSLLGKVDKDGNPVWVISFGGNNTSGGCPYPITDADDHSYDVKVDADGFIYVTGFFSGYDADFDGFTITNPQWGNDCQPMGYIGKLDSNGNWLWVDKFDGIKDQRGSRDNRLAIDQLSNIYVVGGFQNRGVSQTGTYGPFSITSNGEWDAFIFKMDENGNWLWAKNVGSNKSDRANSIAIDLDDDIYITGEYRNPMVFTGANASNGTDTLSHKQKRDVFVAKCNGNGDWMWAKRVRSTGTDKPYQMSVDANKQVFLCGTTKGEVTFNSGLVVPPQIPGDTTASAWIAQLDGSSNNGDWVWAKLGGSDTDDDDRAGDICPDGFGNAYAIGFYEDAANFDGTILNSLGRKDIFVWKICLNINNTYDTIYAADSMVFNPIDTGIFVYQIYTVSGCDTNFVNTIVHQKLGVQINYNINNPGTATFTIDGVIQAMPYSQNYWAGETINIVANLQPDWSFIKWRTNNNAILPNSNSITATFSPTASDSCVLVTDFLNAFISGNDTICDNAKTAEVKVYFRGGTAPFTFVYAIDGVTQPPVTPTYLNPYILNTKKEGVYTLLSFSDALSVGVTSGSAKVTVFESPTAFFKISDDTLSILFPSVQLTPDTVNIVSWSWNFGDNTPLSNDANPFHTYPESIGFYQVSLIINDNNGCSDTTFKQVQITDDYWMYIPNSFTPDLDGVNDVFCIQFHGVRQETFYFNVYDRFSTLVYTTSNITDLECELSSNGWDGKHYKTDIDLPMGTYIYEIYYQDFDGWKHQETSGINIIR